MSTGCASTTGGELDLASGSKLTPCPGGSPNCVCSDATDSGHGIEPLTIAGDPEQAWEALIRYIEGQPRFDIKVREGNYVRAEARTRLLRFVDDVEFQRRASEGLIAMRSASRLGYSDLGANRRRLEAVRQALVNAGVVKNED